LLSTTRLETDNVTWGYSSITPDGNILALANGKGPTEIFETRTGRRIDRLERRGLIDSIDLSRDGQFLAIGTGNSGVLWDIAARGPKWTGKGHRDRVFSIRFSPDQQMIATASWDSDVRLWDVATGKELAVLTGHKAAVLNCVFSPDGRTLATKSDDRIIKLWNLATLREVASSLQMLLGSNDQSRLYVNGKQIHQSTFSRNWVPDQDIVRDVTLNAGLNTVVFKVVNDTTEWLGSVRFTDARGQPVEGIKATLNPGTTDRQ
jgi:WD40 repeat protein